MNFKTTILVITVSILIGVGIFFFTSKKEGGLIPPNIQSIKTNPSTPTPKPTLPPLDKNSNLKEEINKLTPEDFSESFNNLKQEL